MRVTALGVCGLIAISLVAVASFAQQQQRRRTPAPTTEAKFWTLDEQNQHQKDLMATRMTNWSMRAGSGGMLAAERMRQGN